MIKVQRSHVIKGVQYAKGTTRSSACHAKGSEPRDQWRGPPTCSRSLTLSPAPYSHLPRPHPHPVLFEQSPTEGAYFFAFLLLLTTVARELVDGRFGFVTTVAREHVDGRFGFEEDAEIGRRFGSGPGDANIRREGPLLPQHMEAGSTSSWSEVL